MNHEGKPLQFFTTIFFGNYDGKIKLNEELKSFQKLTKEELIQMMEDEPIKFVPGFREDFQKYNSSFQ